MTNEERARAIRRTWGLNIALAASASKSDLGEACDGLEAAILTAIDATTAPLVAERERLRELLGQLVKGVDEKHLRIEGPIVVGLGTPDEPYVGWDWTAEWLHHARSALAEKEPG